MVTQLVVQVEVVVAVLVVLMWELVKLVLQAQTDTVEEEGEVRILTMLEVGVALVLLSSPSQKMAPQG